MVFARCAGPLEPRIWNNCAPRRVADGDSAASKVGLWNLFGCELACFRDACGTEGLPIRGRQRLAVGAGALGRECHHHEARRADRTRRRSMSRRGAVGGRRSSSRSRSCHFFSMPRSSRCCHKRARSNPPRRTAASSARRATSTKAPTGLLLLPLRNRAYQSEGNLTRQSPTKIVGVGRLNRDGTPGGGRSRGALSVKGEEHTLVAVERVRRRKGDVTVQLGHPPSVNNRVAEGAHRRHKAGIRQHPVWAEGIPRALEREK